MTSTPSTPRPSHQFCKTSASSSSPAPIPMGETMCCHPNRTRCGARTVSRIPIARSRGPWAPARGVDINRNFPFVWDADTYYAPSVVPDVGSSKTPCDENFRGYAPPEPETQNLIDLVPAQTIEYLVDVHMQGRKVIPPGEWTPNSIHRRHPNLQQHRLRPQARRNLCRPPYGEYMPNNDVDTRPNLLDRLVSLANAMVAEIINSAGSDPTAIARSTYTAQQSSKLYMTTGAFDDFVFGQQFLNTNLPDTCAFTLECGLKAGSRRNDPGDGEWGFWPDFVAQYPKVEREVHAALFGFQRDLSRPASVRRASRHCPGRGGRRRRWPTRSDHR